LLTFLKSDHSSSRNAPKIRLLDNAAYPQGRIISLPLSPVGRSSRSR